MAVVMLMCVALIGIFCVVAYTLATYAPPFILGLAAARFAYDTGSGLIGADLVAGAAFFGLLVFLFATVRPPLLRLIVVLIFAAPAAMACYALVHGVTHEAVPSEIWRQIFCIIGGAFVGVSALLRLAAPVNPRSAWGLVKGGFAFCVMIRACGVSVQTSALNPKRTFRIVDLNWWDRPSKPAEALVAPNNLPRLYPKMGSTPFA